MAYQKFYVDNTVYKRRFHIAFDDEQEPQDIVTINCEYCGATIFQAKNHPELTYQRSENLTKMNKLSRHIVRQCAMSDVMFESTYISKQKS